MTLPRWDALGSPDRTCPSPVEPSLPHKPIFKVRVKPGQTIINLLDLLEDTEFEHVLSRTNKNRTARRLLELEIQQARDKFEAPRTPEFWDFTDRSELALRSELARYEMRFVEKGRKSIEVLSPKMTKKNLTELCADDTDGEYSDEDGGPSEFATDSGMATYEIRLTDRTRDGIEAISPKSIDHKGCWTPNARTR